jgi:hypothetical protein
MFTELSRFYAAGPKSIPCGVGWGNVLILNRLRLRRSSQMFLRIHLLIGGEVRISCYQDVAVSRVLIW